MEIDRSLQAIADPTRRAILDRLRQGEATMTEMLGDLPQTQPTISAHLKVLEGAGLIRRRRDGTRRPCVLVPEGLRAVDGWLSGFRELWDDRFDNLAREIAAEREEKKHGR